MRYHKKLFKEIYYVLVFLLLMKIFILPYDISCEAMIGEDSTPPINGDWIIDSYGNIITNETIVLNGSLFIKDGGSLTFQNVTLLMNCPVNGTYNIEVEDGGSFFIFDNDENASTISDNSIISSTKVDGKHRFHFYIKNGANFAMKNSELHECGYFSTDPLGAYWTEGLCIETPGAIIENCILSNNYIGLQLKNYADNCLVINTEISFSLLDGCMVYGYPNIHTLQNIIIKDCIITTNGHYGNAYGGICLGVINNSIIENCGIYHHPGPGISFGGLSNFKIINSEIANNFYGFENAGGNSNLNITNNSIIGNIRAVYNYANSPLDIQYNYFGTNNPIQIQNLILGKNVNFSNWLETKKTRVLIINKTITWKNIVKQIDQGIIIDGNLHVENSKLILNNSTGKNFIQVNGKLYLNNSIIDINNSNSKIFSNWGVQTIIFLSNSTGALIDSEIQQQKGIVSHTNLMSLSNVSIIGYGNRPKSFWGILSYGKHLLIEQCKIYNSTYGIEINSINNTIENCDIFSNHYGVYLNSNKCTVSNSNINNCGNGIWLNGENNKVIDSNISKNGGGIYINAGGFNLINRSNISNSKMHGIYSISGFNNTIINCNFSNNGYEGIYLNRAGLLDPPKNYKIYNNEFYFNGFNENATGQAYDKGSTILWDNGYPSGGNYWSDYSGNDFYSGEDQDIKGSDGLGDDPYKISGYYRSDRYPLMYPTGIRNSINTPFLNQIPSPDSDGNYTLTWTSILNATNYTIFEEYKGIINTTTLGSITNFKIIGKPNGTYIYYVQAKNAKVVSRKSNTITIVVDYPPDIPRGLNAIPLPKGNSLDLIWELNEVDTINYSLWSNYTGTWQILENITHPLNNFLHTGLIDGQKYYYKIKAWDGINQSSRFSKIIYGIPGDLIPPSIPIGLNACTISNSSIKLTWEPNNESDLAGYDLYRTKDVETNFSKINIEPILDNNYLDTGLKGNTTYYYKLKAYDEVPNFSEFSDIAFNTTYLTSPRIISFSPTGTNVSLDSEIIITFSKPMNKLSVENRIKIEPVIVGEFIWNDQNGLLILKPTNGFNENITYNITLVNPILDLEGGMLVRTFSWEFRTIELPKIIQHSPQGDFVNTDTNITITFNRNMNKKSVQKAISIEPEINGTFKWITEKKLIFEPDNKLPELTSFEITIDYLAQDLFGNTIQDDFSWSFRTGDFTAPEIISYSPTGDDVEVDTQISIVFTEPMNRSRVEASFNISPNFSGEFQWRGNTLVFLPYNNLKYDTKYTITLSSNATDKWGNNLVDDLSWEFTTEKSPGNDDQSIGYDMILVSGIIVIVIILIVIIISVILRKRRESSTGDVIQQQDETLEE